MTRQEIEKLVEEISETLDSPLADDERELLVEDRWELRGMLDDQESR